MPAGDFHDKPFDEGTLTKLDLFELYTHEWLPVFLANPVPRWQEVHIYDFFAGPGSDSTGQPGSPLRLVRQLAAAAAEPRYKGWTAVKVHLHLSDDDPAAIARLQAQLKAASVPAGIELQVQRKDFANALEQALPVLRRGDVAKLVLIDQFGVGQVADDRFKTLISSPACDFLFFISSSTLHRFHDHPSIQQKIVRPNDHYHVH